MELSVDKMELADLDAVLALENIAFVSPWSRSSFLYELLENPRAVYLAAKFDGRLAGYIGMWEIFDEGHITNLAVHPDFRRQGIARRLLGDLTEIAKSHGIIKLTLEVRQSNLPAQFLYAKIGFIKAGIRRKYYRDNNEDALIMWKSPI